MKMTVQRHSQYHPKGAVTELNNLIQLQFWATSFGNTLRRTTQVLGVNRSIAKSRGLDFEEVRMYQQGDDVRSIDWRVTAKTGKPHTKLFREEKERPVYFLVDQSPTMFFGSRHCFKAVMANHIAALLAWSTLRHGDRIGGLVFNQHGHQEIKARRSQKQVLRLCQLMVLYNQQLASDSNKPAQTETLSKALSQLSQVAKPGSRVFVISDFSQYNSHCKALLTHLSQHVEVNCFMVYDTIEKSMPAIGQAAFANRFSVGANAAGASKSASELVSAAVNTSSAKFQQQYRSAFKQHQQYIQTELDALWIPHVTVATHDSLIEKMQQVFR